MSATQFRLITLPNNLTDNGFVRISLFVSPIIPTTTSLPLFLKRWPVVADSLQFQVDLKDNAGNVQSQSYQARPTQRYPDGTQLESADDAQVGWQSIFEDPTPAVLPQPPATVQSIVSTPISVLHDGIRSFHQRVANGEAPSVVAVDVAKFTSTLEELEAFHGRCKPKQVTWDNREFHDRFSGLVRYTSVMRLLRLVIDLEVTGLKSADLPLGGSICGYISGIGSSAPSEAAALSDPNQASFAYPWVQYAFDARTQAFTAATPGGTERFGLAALGSNQYYWAELDVDAGGLGLLNHVARKTSWDSLTALPDRRGKGVQVFDLMRAASIPTLTQQVNAADTALATNPTPFKSRPTSNIGVPPFDASYLLRGYRIDVIRPAESPDDWRSLCKRQVTVSGLPHPVPRLEEAAVNSGLTSAPDGAKDKKMATIDWKSSQVFFRWTGWSLVAPRPRPKSDPPQPDHPIAAAVQPKSLMPLRYGSQYKFRARAVDIGGNGLSANQAKDLEKNLALNDVWLDVDFLRQDIVPPPSVKQQQGAASGSTVIIAMDSQIHQLWLIPPSADHSTMQLAGALDNLTNAGKSAERQGYRGIKHFRDPSVSGVVASIGRSSLDATNIAPQTLGFKPESGASKEIQNLLVESNRSIGLVCKAGPKLSLKSQSLLNQVVVSVPPGRVVELLIRSLIDIEKLKQLELYGVEVQKYLLYGAQYSTLAGPLRLIIVHAIQKPLVKPSFSSSGVTAIRKPGTTAVTFTAANITLDQESTGHIELAAEWEDVVDEVDKKGKWPTRSKVSANLANATVPLPQGHPWRPIGDKTPKDEKGLTLQGVYDFGDGKFRRLDRVYLLGTSRFARYYSNVSTSNPLPFSRVSSPIPLSLEASTPPSPPQMEYIVPTIARTDVATSLGTTHRDTEVWGIRIYLKRGWFSSGDEESLAVILTSSSTDPNIVSLMGADPTRQGQPVRAALAKEDFRSGKYVGNVSSGGESFEIMRFPVSLDRSKNLICADVLFNARHDYRVFARFTLARFQPNGQVSAQLSTIVTADFIQLGPTRGLTITKATDTFSITVTGPGTDQTASARNQVIAISETKESDGEPWKEEERVLLSPQESSQLMDYVWTGEIRRTRGSSNRIVIEEFEIVDDRQQSIGALDLELSGRLVFSDSFEY